MAELNIVCVWVWACGCGRVGVDVGVWVCGCASEVDNIKCHPL